MPILIQLLLPYIISTIEKYHPLTPEQKDTLTKQIETVDINPIERFGTVVADKLKTVIGSFGGPERLQFELELNSMLGQLELTKMDAADPRFFHSGWRPSLAWLGIIGIAINTIGLFLFHTVLFILSFTHVDPATVDHAAKMIPTVDITLLGTLLVQMLGLAYQVRTRTVEKLNDVDTR